MKIAKPLSAIALFFGLLLCIAGLFFVVLYVKDAIILRWDETDQSLIFWYLPFLFAGIGALISGGVIGQAGLRGLKKNPAKTAP